MSSVATAIVGSAVVGAVASSAAAKKGAKAAQSAADAQSASAQAGIDEQARQFDQVRELLNPYVQAGNGALTGQQNLLGLNGVGSQAAAIAQIQNSPVFTSMLQRGENSLRQNASATGGLRGGNLQAALAQFSPQLLAQQIQQQYENLGGLTSLGQNAAAGVGNAGMSTGRGIADLLQQQGAAQAGGVMSGYRADMQGINGLAGSAGTIFGGIRDGSFAGFGRVGGTNTGIMATNPTFGAGAIPGFGMTGFGATPPTSGGILGYQPTFGM